MAKKRKISWKRRLGRTAVALYCAAFLACMVFVLLFTYVPNKNALGALGSVSMDVVSIAVLVILVIGTAFSRNALNKTAKLFLCLMIVTLWGLFFDFLTWSADGSLAYGEWTYVFTVASLCTGAVMAFIFGFYLSSYMDDMHGMKEQYKPVRICAVLNALAFVITLTLALMKEAFVFVDGHYEVGVLYDVITVIPILTLIYMTVYCVRKVKLIGLHDAVAVAGFILIMIIGTLIEAIHRVGSTYVSVAIADVFIFMMLQNKVFDRVRDQKDRLDEAMASQFEILNSMVGIYSYVNYIDFVGQTARRFDVEDSESERLDVKRDPHTTLNKGLMSGVVSKQKERFWAYTNLSTLSDRMKNEKLISAEFQHNKDGWFRAQYIRIGGTTDGPLERVIYAIRNIDEEKKNVEQWIQKSNTDELTGFYNRRAYEEDIIALEADGLKDNFIYASMDINSLKQVNDTLGHEAGDELIVGACQCMEQSLGAYGKLYRTGGDEFVALIYADDEHLTEIKRDIEELTEKWSGQLVDHLAISCGFVQMSDAEGMNLHQIAVLADQRMYEDKKNYYQKKGVDRRGQRDAHVALCARYVKIFKINLADDSYQIINMSEEERQNEPITSNKLSEWMHDFAHSDLLYSDDREDYLAKTDRAYLSEYFKNHQDALTLFYRKKYGDTYKKTLLEFIPANDYTDEVQTLFLYTKVVE